MPQTTNIHSEEQNQNNVIPQDACNFIYPLEGQKLPSVALKMHSVCFCLCLTGS